MEAAISQELKDFVHERIATPNEVPVLLWLWSHPEQRLTPAALAASVGFNETACADALDDLVRSGLSVCVDRIRSLFAYRGIGERAELMLSELARAYAESRVEVLSLIANNAMARIRRAAVRSFVDCQNVVLTPGSPSRRR